MINLDKFPIDRTDFEIDHPALGGCYHIKVPPKEVVQFVCVVCKKNAYTPVQAYCMRITL